MASLVAQTVKCLPAVRETRVPSPRREDPWRRKWHPTPVLLPGKFHGPRSLVGYSPRGSQRGGHDWATSLHVRHTRRQECMNHACESHWRSVLTRSALLHGLQPPGSSVHGTLQARILERVAMPSARGYSWPRDRTCIYYVFYKKSNNQ